VEDKADGLHEELLNQLSDMKPLDLASRTSVLQYRDTTENLRVIGHNLGVEYIVEGSVQKVGDEPRITLQVIEVSSDRHISSQSFAYVADKTQDETVQQKSFAFELALSIYRSIRDQRPPAGESARVLASETSRLQAEFQHLSPNSSETPSVATYRSLIELLTRFREIDPDNSFARANFAWVLTQKAYAGVIADDHDPDFVREVSLALNQALLVDPDNFVALEQMGDQLVNRLGRPHDAVAYLRRVVADQEQKSPGGWNYNSWAHTELAQSLYKSGQANAAVAVLGRVPSDKVIVTQIYEWRCAFRADRRPAELIALLKSYQGHLHYRNLPMSVMDAYLDLCMAETELCWEGSPKPALSLCEKFKGNPDISPGFTLVLLKFTDHYQEMLDTLSKVGAGYDPMEPSADDLALIRITALRGLGNDTLARSYLQSMLREISTDDPYAEVKWGERAHYCALLGDRDAAVRAIAASRAALDPERDFYSYVEAQRQIALAYAQLGMPSESCAAIDAVLSGPGDYLTGNFLMEPDISPIRHSPEFEAVIRKHADQLKDPTILDTFFARPGA
jgi:tetratricopeptide (TPR) repeat protein